MNEHQGYNFIIYFYHPVPLNPTIGVVMCSTRTPTQPMSLDFIIFPFMLFAEDSPLPPGTEISNINLLVDSTENSISFTKPSVLYQKAILFYFQ